MTAELNEEIESPGRNNTNIQTKKDVANTELTYELPTGILEIFEFLSVNKNIIFKSQQIDDPDIERDEKIQIARSIYSRNRQIFLMRFGTHLEEHHLKIFARFALSEGAAPLRSDEHCEEMQIMLKDYQRKLKTRKLDVKNRRYTALKHLEKQGEYFSEQEMMKRSPTLYQELVGQYLTEAEKKQRDCYDVKNTTFSGILMHSLEKQQLEDVLKQAEENNIASDEADIHKDYTENKLIFQTAKADQLLECGECEYDEVPASFRQQWGTFDNEKIECSSTRTQPFLKLKHEAKSKKFSGVSENTKLITAGERALLRQEFIGLMHEQFLSGQDYEFDYTQVDDNSMLDDLRQLNQDKEDAYFEESESEEEVEQQLVEDEPKSLNETADESDDELDIYMSHLNNHHSLRN